MVAPTKSQAVCLLLYIGHIAKCRAVKYPHIKFLPILPCKALWEGSFPLCGGMTAAKTEFEVLFTQTELFDDSSVTRDVLLLKVAEKVSSLTNHLKKTSVAVMVLRVVLKMSVEGVDTVGEDSDLHLGRTGISLGELVLCDDLLLNFFGNHGFFTFLNMIFVYSAKRCDRSVRSENFVSGNHTGLLYHIFFDL